MAYTWPTPGTTGWDVPLIANLDDMDSRISAIPVGGGTATDSIPGVVHLDTFTGASDDAKLTNALSYVAAQTYMPSIGIWGRTFAFSQSRQVFQGMRFTGCPIPGYQGTEQANSKYSPAWGRVNLSTGAGTSSWLNNNTAGTVYYGAVNHLSINGNGASQFVDCPGGTLFGWTFHNLQFNAMAGVFGTTARQCLLTLAHVSGPWEITSPTATQINIGGSDCILWQDGCNIGASGNGTNLGNGRYLAWFNSLGKSTVGPMYFTADDKWRAIRVTGSGGAGPGLSLVGMRVEGRNTTDWSSGALISLESGAVRIERLWLAYGMAQPSDYTDRTDRGLIHQTGGEHIISGVSVDRATAAGVTQDTPIYFVSGGTGRISEVQLGTKGGAWTARPVVQQTTAGLVASDAVDSTVRLITAA